jgi:hypothetical protein
MHQQCINHLFSQSVNQRAAPVANPHPKLHRFGKESKDISYSILPIQHALSIDTQASHLDLHVRSCWKGFSKLLCAHKVCSTFFTCTWCNLSASASFYDVTIQNQNQNRKKEHLSESSCFMYSHTKQQHATSK